MARKKERELMSQAVVDLYIDDQVRAANDQVQAMRAARQKVDADPKLALLWQLRREGWSLRDALEEIERRAGGSAASHAS